MVNGYTAASLQEALELRKAHPEAVPYAGGTDLMVENRPGVTYLFLNKVPELKTIAEDDQYVRIGAGVTFTEALADERVPRLMKEAVSRIAAPAIRNAGTFGGNLVLPIRAVICIGIPGHRCGKIQIRFISRTGFPIGNICCRILRAPNTLSFWNILFSERV